MEYSIHELAELSGVSRRALRHYDEIGLLTTQRVSGNNYRVYGQVEVDLLQQILFYRELGVPLEEIRILIQSESYDRTTALEGHLKALQTKKQQLELLISNLTKTIAASKGEIAMSDKEKFEGLKQKMLEENEQKYGAEIREKYGSEAVEASNRKFSAMTPEQHREIEELTAELNQTLRAAFEQGDPAGVLAQQACALHKKWLGYFWSSYSKEAHRGLGQMYVDDPRFTAYYDGITPGCTPFFRDALNIFCKEESNF